MPFFTLLITGCSLRQIDTDVPCSSQTFRKEISTPYTDKVVQFMSIVNQCSDKVWPNLILHKSPYVLNERGREYIIVTHPPHCSRPLYQRPNSNIQKELKSSGNMFGGILIEGKQSIFVRSLPSSILSLMRRKYSRPRYDFRFLIHEAFHMFDQKLWPSERDIQRFTLKRTGCTPRKYRYLIKYYLEEALQSSSSTRQKAIRKAAYWNKKHRKEFPEEVYFTDVMDAIEGTAQYVDTRAWALVQVGCSASKKALKDAFIKTYQSKEKEQSFSRTREAYDIGALASALLDEYPQYNNWQKKIETGLSPTQILLQPFSPLKSSYELSEIKKKCNKLKESLQREKFVIRNFRKMLSSKNYIALSFTIAGGPLSSTSGGVFIPLKGVIRGYETGFYRLTSSFPKSKSSKMKLGGYYLLIPEKERNLCGRSQKVVLVPKKEIDLNGQIFDINYQGKKKINGEVILLDQFKGRLRKKSYKGFMPFFVRGSGIIDKKIEQLGADLWCIR